MQTFRNKRGFALIEVIMVLAIAALIILIVLSNVTHAQKSQHDDKRKKMAAQPSAQFINYAADHNGSYAGFSCSQYCSSIQDSASPTGKPGGGGPDGTRRDRIMPPLPYRPAALRC